MSYERIWINGKPYKIVLTLSFVAKSANASKRKPTRAASSKKRVTANVRKRQSKIGARKVAA